jgi:hypothetical protein
MMRAIGGAALLALLAGCGDGGDAPRNVTSIEVGEGAYVERLRELSPQYRDLALRRAIQDAGKSCRRIEGSAEQGSYENLSMWTARCEGGDQWAIFIAPTGDVQVRDCAQAEQLGLPPCRAVEAQENAGSSSVNE